MRPIQATWQVTNHQMGSRLPAGIYAPGALFSAAFDLDRALGQRHPGRRTRTRHDVNTWTYRAIFCVSLGALTGIRDYCWTYGLTLFTEHRHGKAYWKSRTRDWRQ